MSLSDTIYQQGIDFTALKRELSVQNLWRGRTWKDMLRHFVTTLLFSTLWSFLDIGADGLPGKSFIVGSNYTKWVKDLSVPAYHDKCVHTQSLKSFNQ